MLRRRVRTWWSAAGAALFVTATTLVPALHLSHHDAPHTHTGGGLQYVQSDAVAATHHNELAIPAPPAEPTEAPSHRHSDGADESETNAFHYTAAVAAGLALPLEYASPLSLDRFVDRSTSSLLRHVGAALVVSRGPPTLLLP